MNLVGVVIGVLVAAIGFGLRRRFWTSVSKAGQVISYGVLALSGIAMLLLIFATFTKGGDAAMNAMTVLIFVALGLASAFVVALVGGAVQASWLRRPYRKVAMSLGPEVLLVLLIIWQAQDLMQKSMRDDYQRTAVVESQRRENARQLAEKVPMRYRGITSDMLYQMESEQRELRRRGMTVPDMIPQDVANAIRNRDNAMAAPPQYPSPVVTSYAELSRTYRDFNYSILGSWLVGVLLVPFATKRVTGPPPIETEP
ncbi:MAG: hypothetical protein JNJ45_00925 [Chthonomonas sp.]|nr:hypothetical protein [Chthonomonas sp.]